MLALLDGMLVTETEPLSEMRGSPVSAGAFAAHLAVARLGPNGYADELDLLSLAIAVRALTAGYRMGLDDERQARGIAVSGGRGKKRRRRRRRHSDAGSRTGIV